MEEHEIVLRDSPSFQRGKRLKKILSLSLSEFDMKIRPPIDRIDYQKPYPRSH